jgi:predicted HicB family RNase H-like nuclease
MKYKGYIAHFFFDETLQLFQGKVSNIHDLITFQGKSMETLRFAFHDAVNEHLAWCKKIGKDPERPNRVQSLL